MPAAIAAVNYPIQSDTIYFQSIDMPAKTQSKRPEPGDPSVRPLSDFLCFAIYSANLAFGRAYKPMLEELGITYTQYITIIALWEENPQTVSGLGEKLFLESNTLTPILKKLEEMGYVRRQRDPGDERQVQVSLTEAGKRLRERAAGSSLVQATGLSPDEFRRLQRGVVGLRDNLVRSMRDE